MSRGWLIVFAKAPRAGLVKTRMSPPLSLEVCAQLYDEMLVDVLNASGRFSAQLDLMPVLAYYPADAHGELAHRAPPGFRLQVQYGAGLGERMDHAVAEAAAAGVDRILVRGSDSPALSFACLEAAMNRLDAGDDLVLTPDQGGGYALIGLRAPAPSLFDIPMSRDSVLDQTLERAARLGMSCSTTPATFDLDTVGDTQLLQDLSDEEKADLCPRTVQFLSTAPEFDVL